VLHLLHMLHGIDATSVKITAFGVPAMPAKSPRLTFTPTRRSFELLSKISATTGVPVSATCRDMMEALEDHLEMLAIVQTQVVALNAGAKQAAAAASKEAAEALTPLMEEASRIMLKMATAIDQPALPFDGKPPSSNTGVKTPTQATGG
jgi:hypothetical protein